MMAPSCFIHFKRPDGSLVRHAFTQPRHVLTAADHAEIMPLLRRIETETANGMWAVGIVAYEAAPAFDAAMQTRPPHADFPLACFALFDAPAATEMVTEGTFSCGPWHDETTPTAYENNIAQIRTAIGNGNYYQANFTTRLRSKFSGTPAALFAALTEAQPSDYQFYFDHGDWQIASVSPELFFAYEPASRRLITKPMKGTAQHTDAAAKAALQNSAKDRAENLMIVDLLRNDLSRVATTGSVKVTNLFAVETLPTALQMTSTITATAKPNTGLADIFAALFPCGSITGAPKIAAMQALARLEPSPRGAYCGALGVVMPGGDAIFNVGIRTVTVKNGEAICGIGGGVVWDSTPQGEFAESRIKRRFLLRASADFDLLETMRLENGIYALLPRHLHRLANSAAHFGFALDLDKVQNALQTLTATNKATHRIRLLVNRNGHIKTEAYALEPPKPEPLPIMLATSPVDSHEEFLRHKTTSRAIYEQHAPCGDGIFDTLLFNERGELTEFTRGNVVIKMNGKLWTPPESCGLLPGTRRAAMLATGEIVERVMLHKELQAIEEIYFLNSLRGMITVKIKN